MNTLHLDQLGHDCLWDQHSFQFSHRQYSDKAWPKLGAWGHMLMDHYQMQLLWPEIILCSMPCQVFSRIVVLSYGMRQSSSHDW